MKKNFKPLFTFALVIMFSTMFQPEAKAWRFWGNEVVRGDCETAADGTQWHQDTNNYYVFGFVWSSSSSEHKPC
jgi:hypothetical protein